MQQDDEALRLRLLQALYNVRHVCRFDAFKVVEVAVAQHVIRSVGLWLLTDGGTPHWLSVLSLTSTGVKVY